MNLNSIFWYKYEKFTHHVKNANLQNFRRIEQF
jgi:hypothetical protein